MAGFDDFACFDFEDYQDPGEEVPDEMLREEEARFAGSRSATSFRQRGNTQVLPHTDPLTSWSQLSQLTPATQMGNASSVPAAPAPAPAVAIEEEPIPKRRRIRGKGGSLGAAGCRAGAQGDPRPTSQSARPKHRHRHDDDFVRKVAARLHNGKRR